MPRVQRKSAMKVQGGRVLRKNNWQRSQDDLWNLAASEIRLVREDPGHGLRHLVTIPQLRAFLERLPMWDEVAVGLRAVVLSGDDDAMGWHDTGVIALCGWERELWWNAAHPAWVAEHERVLDRLGVEREGDEVRFTEEQARAFQLLHVIPHELGHHRDRMTTRSRRQAARGEPYAERYANTVFDLLWPEYGPV